MSRFGALALASLTASLPGQTTYQLTTGTYAWNDDWLAGVRAEFGQTAMVADFADLKTLYNSNPQLLIDLIGQTYRSTAFVTYNGQQYQSVQRAYFAEVHLGALPGGFLAYDEIGGNQVTLGSYSLSGVRIIAAIPSAVPEPSAYGIALGGLALAAAAVRRRRADR